jgi:Protein of unknown function DUF262
VQLEKEIQQRAKEIHTDAYAMSIGEVMNLYESNELDIHPEFQRFFRWSPKQKSRLIESILLGIPIPSIFVAQRDDGVWDVVDGLQRLATIFEFVGILRDEEGAPVPASRLEATLYLPSLEGVVWESDEPRAVTLTNAQRLTLKRARLDFKIVQKESDPSTKYELFQRLNTGGSQLSDQEVRNCVLIMINRDFYLWLQTLQGNSSFQLCVAMSERQIEEQYDLELILRFLTFTNSTDIELRGMTDLRDFLDNVSVRYAQDSRFDYETQALVFERTFRLLEEALGDEAFRRYDGVRNRFMGGFSVSAYEAVSAGVAANLDAWEAIDSRDERKDRITRRVQELWSNQTFRQSSGSGIRATSRIPVIVPLGQQFMRP